MKAARIIGPGIVDLMEVEKPRIGCLDVLARVKYVGMCGTDLALLRGDSFLIREGLVKYPITPGHEWSGIVEEVGEEVTSLSPGDLVVGDTCVSCGECVDCLTGNYNACKNTYGVGTIGNWDGAFAEFILMPARHVFKIPSGVPLEAAALTEPASIAGHAVFKGDVRPGDVVVVQGTGAIGLFAVQYAKVAGASKVILSGRKDWKLEIGATLGADITVNILKDDLIKRVREVTAGRGADIVIEASGAPQALTLALDIVRSGGKIAVVGFFEAPPSQFDINKLVVNDIALVGVAGCPGISPRTLQLMQAGRIRCESLITHHFPLEQINEAFKVMVSRDDRRIKVMLEVNSDGK